MQSSCCGSSSGETLIFTCAGAAHTGQVANRAGVQLMQQQSGKLFCIAAMAAEIPDKLERARNASKRIAIDGCEDHCCRRIMDKVNLPVDHHVVVTDLGIEKQPKEPQMLVDAKRIVEHVEALVAEANG